MDPVTELPFRVAVTTAVWLTMFAPARAVNEPVANPAATVTDPGRLSAPVLLESVTTAPPVGAALVRVTVQVLEALGPRLAGLQASEETSTDATRLTFVVTELPL
jgi:hypothetical protein